MKARDFLFPIILSILCIIFHLTFEYETFEAQCIAKNFTPKYETINPSLPEGHFRKKEYYRDAWTITFEHPDEILFDANCNQTDWEQIKEGDIVIVSRQRGTKRYDAKPKA